MWQPWPKHTYDSFTKFMYDTPEPYKLPQTDDLTIGCGKDLMHTELWYVEIAAQPPYTPMVVASQRQEPYTLDFHVRCGAKDYPGDQCVRLCQRCMKANGLLW